MMVDVAKKLKDVGLRPTRQRIMLGSLLWRGEDRHITAEQLHTEAKDANMPVSMATVYNTLHQFVDAGLLSQMCVGDGVAYFDTNTNPHHHYYYEENGILEDIPAHMVVIDGAAVDNAARHPNHSVHVLIRVHPQA